LPQPWYRAIRVEAFLGISRVALDTIMANEILTIPQRATFNSLLNYYTAKEPLTVAAIDAGYNQTNTPDAVVLEVAAFQTDAGLNEIPQATVRLGVGRDAQMVAAGAPDLLSTSVVHLIEKVFSTFRLPAKLFVRALTTEEDGNLDGFDNVPFDNEWVVMFEGTVTGVNRRGGEGGSSVSLHLTHFLSALSDSSSVSGQVTAGPFNPAAMSPLLVPFRNANALPPAFTAFGGAALAMAGGQALDTDFWGYQVPGGVGNTPPNLVGIKGFFNLLASQDTFAWENLARADLGSSACVVGRRRNDLALSALAKIEPMWPSWTSQEAATEWSAALTTIKGIRTLQSSAITRQNIKAIAGGAYDTIGYRYGMPIAFYLSNSALVPLPSGRAFAMDIAGATFADLAGNTFWGLLSGQYSSRYQIAIAPMADRAVVLPVQPILDKYWQSISDSEIIAWDDDFSNPIAIRGIILTSDHPSTAGVYASGNDASGAGVQGQYQMMSAGFDSCDAGAFEVRTLPPWLINLWRPAEVYAAKTATVPFRARADVPWTTGLNALAAVTSAFGGPLAFASTGLSASAPTAPPDWAISTSARLAKAMYQQERTRHNTLYVTSRFRYDIGPGSLVKVALPGDRYVRQTLLGDVNTVNYGMVLRVTISVDCESHDYRTHLSVGFARTEGQADRNSKLFADIHPFWSTACLGVPWADAQWIRDTLGNNSTIAPDANV